MWPGHASVRLTGGCRHTVAHPRVLSDNQWLRTRHTGDSPPSLLFLRRTNAAMKWLALTSTFALSLSVLLACLPQILDHGTFLTWLVSGCSLFLWFVIPRLVEFFLR